MDSVVLCAVVWKQKNAAFYPFTHETQNPGTRQDKACLMTVTVTHLLTTTTAVSLMFSSTM